MPKCANRRNHHHSKLLTSYPNRLGGLLCLGGLLGLGGLGLRLGVGLGEDSLILVGNRLDRSGRRPLGRSVAK